MKNKICTSLEQSQKLIELGINVNTADMFWDTLFAKKPEAQVNNHHLIDEYDDEHRVPAWSLTALLKLIPKFSLEKDISNNAGYQLHYNYNTTYYDEPIDAAVEMICWLKKYNKL